MNVLIIGSGGHGQVVADILLSMNASGNIVTPIGFLDDDPHLAKKSVMGLPIIGTIEQIDLVTYDTVIMGIGSNHVRQRLFKWLQDKNVTFATAIHPKAIIAQNVQIEIGTSVAAGVIINTGASIGANVILNTGCTVDHHCIIEDHVHLAPGTHLGGDITVGTGTLVGIGATIMPQKNIGSWSTIAAGSLVHRDVPSNVTVMGLPAVESNN